MPMPTATMRSTETVTRAVMMNTVASEPVEPMMLRTVAIEIMRAAVIMSTPESAASGICETTPVAR